MFGRGSLLSLRQVVALRERSGHKSVSVRRWTPRSAAMARGHGRVRTRDPLCLGLRRRTTSRLALAALDQRDAQYGFRAVSGARRAPTIRRRCAHRSMRCDGQPEHRNGAPHRSVGSRPRSGLHVSTVDPASASRRWPGRRSSHCSRRGAAGARVPFPPGFQSRRTRTRSP